MRRSPMRVGHRYLAKIKGPASTPDAYMWSARAHVEYGQTPTLQFIAEVLGKPPGDAAFLTALRRQAGLDEPNDGGARTGM
jgi:hypothetical protein